MKLILTSDLHYGFDQNTQKIHERFFECMGHAIQEHGARALILAGDSISHKQGQWPKFLELVREHVKIPIGIVRGNHCLWDREEEYVYSSFEVMIDYQETLFKKFDVQHLSEPLIIEDVAIIGFDGWYANGSVESNDTFFIPRSKTGQYFHDVLSKRAHADLERVLEYQFATPIRKRVCVTHFPPFTHEPKYLPHYANPNYMDAITSRFDVLCVGHSHRFEDFLHGNCRVMNAGSDYNRPAFWTFEV